MMKKLAVTVFVLSLAAFGCGSDDGTPERKDSGPDTGKDTSTQKLDTIQADKPMPGPEAGPEAQADKPVPIDEGRLDAGAVDVEPIDQGTVDGGEIDGGAPDKPVTPPDGPAIDGGEELDGGGTTVDGGTVG